MWTIDCLMTTKRASEYPVDLSAGSVDLISVSVFTRHTNVVPEIYIYRERDLDLADQ